MDVTVTQKDLGKVMNLTKALRKAVYKEIGGDELAAFSQCMYWIHDMSEQLKKPEPIVATTKPKKVKKNVGSKPKRK